MHPMLNTAIRAARRAGSVIMRHLDRLDSLTIEAKGRHDPCVLPRAVPEAPLQRENSGRQNQANAIGAHNGQAAGQPTTGDP